VGECQRVPEDLRGNGVELIVGKVQQFQARLGIIEEVSEREKF